MPTSRQRWLSITGALVIVWLSVSGSVAAETRLHFLAVASVSSTGTKLYQRFLQQVQPVWRRHGMELKASGKAISVQGVQDVALIAVASRKGFQAYLRDPDYLAIKKLRLDAVDSLTVVELLDIKGLEACLTPVLNNDPASSSTLLNCMPATARTAYSVKGAVPAWLTQ